MMKNAQMANYLSLLCQLLYKLLKPLRSYKETLSHQNSYHPCS